jgi:hypothetical protein
VDYCDISKYFLFLILRPEGNGGWPEGNGGLKGAEAGLKRTGP